MASSATIKWNLSGEISLTETFKKLLHGISGVKFFFGMLKKILDYLLV